MLEQLFVPLERKTAEREDHVVRLLEGERDHREDRAVNSTDHLN